MPSDNLKTAIHVTPIFTLYWYVFTRGLVMHISVSVRGLSLYEVLGGILVSLRSSIRPSVAATILVGSISYLYVSSSNFRGCVACKKNCEFSKFECLAIFLNL